MKKLLIFLCFAAFFAQNQAFADEQFNRDRKNYNSKLQIFNKNKQIAEFYVALANNDKTRQYGLMNLPLLAYEHGMLFIFDQEQIIKMWMKNTLIELDMIFIDKNNVIVNIEHRARPQSLSVISSQKLADKVLEINGQLCQKLGIKKGQKIIYGNI